MNNGEEIGKIIKNIFIDDTTIDFILKDLEQYHLTGDEIRIIKEETYHSRPLLFQKFFPDPEKASSDLKELLLQIEKNDNIKKIINNLELLFQRHQISEKQVDQIADIARIFNQKILKNKKIVKLFALNTICNKIRSS